MKRGLLTNVLALLALAGTASAADEAAEAWQPAAPRDEIRPAFAYQPAGGYDNQQRWIIATDHRAGLDGYWTRDFPVEGGQTYQFQVYRRDQNLSLPRRQALVRLLWLDDAGNSVPEDRQLVEHVRNVGAQAVAEHPLDQPGKRAGWAEVTGVYRAPQAARRARVELHLMWAADARVEWSAPSFTQTAARPPRLARLATVHYRPELGTKPAEKCAQFAPLIAEAARQQADLVVLPETLTYYRSGKTPAEVAEPVPGPATDYFGRLAKQHDLYIVAGLFERDEHLVYNVAVLIGPDGDIVGKYRKVTIPTGELERGVAAGDNYPVFDTRFGKVGMMICYDGFFPEVARELSNAGAEVIAWPVWGCNPQLGRARAIENHVYLVSSTYTGADDDWIISAVFDHSGRALVQAQDWGTVVVAEVDLNHATRWRGTGDFKSKVYRHRPE